MILILKPGKSLEDITSKRVTSLLPTLSKVLEKILQQLNPLLEKENIIPGHQFGFYKHYGIIEEKSLETKNIP